MPGHHRETLLHGVANGKTMPQGAGSGVKLEDAVMEKIGNLKDIMI